MTNSPSICGRNPHHVVVQKRSVCVEIGHPSAGFAGKSPVLIARPPFRTFSSTSIDCKALHWRGGTTTEHLVSVESGTLGRQKGKEGHRICTLTGKGNGPAVRWAQSFACCGLLMARPLSQPLLDIKGLWPLGPRVGSSSGLASLPRTLSFQRTKFRWRLCISWWCFSPVGVWWFCCSNLFYGLSSAFDYVNFAWLYHQSLPFFSHFEMKDRVHNDEGYREWKWK